MISFSQLVILGFTTTVFSTSLNDEDYAKFNKQTILSKLNKIGYDWSVLVKGHIQLYGFNVKRVDESTGNLGQVKVVGFKIGTRINLLKSYLIQFNQCVQNQNNELPD